MGERRLRHVRVAVAAAVAVLTAPAVAAPPASEGAMLAAPCAACHAPDARSIPAIAGLPAETLGELLLKYQSGEIEGTVMNRIAAGYTPEQIRAIADHLGHPGTGTTP